MFKKDLDRDELLGMLEEARDHMVKAIEILRSVTDDRSVEVSLIANLEMHLSDDHGWAGRVGMTVQDLIDMAEDETGDEGE